MSRRVEDQHPEQESLPEESDEDEKILMRNRTWRIKFCPGSSDGCDERTELIRKRERALSQTLQWMTTLGIQESTPIQTGTRAQDQTCQS